MPQNLSDPIKAFLATDPRTLIEIVVDVGKEPVLWFTDDSNTKANAEVTEADLTICLDSLIGDKKQFTSDNRCGISRTLHRISALRNRFGKVVGLTYRIGRNVRGVCQIISDLTYSVATGGFSNDSSISSPKSLLLLGPPGVGKTTLLRDVTHFLANETKKRVMVVDTSNEIGGDGDVAHSCIGDARRIQVPNRPDQDKTMLEAVQNHTPQVIVVDEIGTTSEVRSAQTISQRGVALVATAHGLSLNNLLKNPVTSHLIGGVQSVTIGDRMAKEMAEKAQSEGRKEKMKKSILERKSSPTFECVVELLGRNNWRCYSRIKDTVDSMLKDDEPVWVERRWLHPNGMLLAKFSQMHESETKEKKQNFAHEVKSNMITMDFEFMRNASSMQM
eukprot:TRINITY_DN10512_c0_g1_i1.p1 TRINITY_DN10512_c0_g1~~TRINITY_DN10512_c0_g1_i1.p1  ORF type:complete len:425 (+),score=79.24 TRINITY_DN10512_c0_g1_i1:109-1275(+)